MMISDIQTIQYGSFPTIEAIHEDAHRPGQPAAVSSFPFTKMPNALLDRYLPELTGTQMKVLMVLIRQTLGYQRKTISLSMRDLCRMTGIQSRDTINRAIRKLVALNLFTSEGQLGQTNTYTITDHALMGTHEHHTDLSDYQTPSPIVQVSEMIACPEIGQVSSTQSDTPCLIIGHVEAQKSDTPCTKTEPPPVQKSDTTKRKNKESTQEKEKEKSKDKEITITTIPPLGILPEEGKDGGGGLTDAGQDAVDRLVSFGIWEESARKLVNERKLTPEGVARAIEAVSAEARGGVGVRSPAGLLRRRLESGWEPPESKRRAYPMDEEEPPEKPKPRQPDFMAAAFTASDGQRWEFGHFSLTLMEKLELQLPRDAFNAWLRSACFTGCTISDGRLENIQLELASQQAYEWVTARLSKPIERMAAVMLGYPLTWSYACKRMKEQVA